MRGTFLFLLYAATIVLMAQLLLVITVSIDKSQIKLYNITHKVIIFTLNSV